jgi:hypothetical protein
MRFVPNSAPVSPPNPQPPEAPWLAGLRAAKANVIPGLILQLTMLALLLAYYSYPPTTAWLDSLAVLKARWNFAFSPLAAVVAGAFLPELLRIAVFQKGRPNRGNRVNLIYTIPFWAVLSAMVDVLYRCQAVWFGSEVTFMVVVKKVIVDQFIFSPLITGPMTVWFYDFKNRGRNACPPREFFTWRHYREAVLPAMFATWGVWIPVVSILYSLPVLLQIPMYILALTLWVMIYTWMSEQQAHRDACRAE